MSVEAFTLTPPPHLSLCYSASPGGAVWLRVDESDHEKVYTPEGGVDVNADRHFLL